MHSSHESSSDAERRGGQMKDNKLKITKTKLARLLRQEQTEAEKELWELLRNRKFENLKFRRQHPLKDYIVDFFCKELNLIIELDGGYHNDPEQREKDELRDRHLQLLGYRTLRFKNKAVFDNQDEIFKSILDAKQTPSPLGEGRGEGITLLSTKKLKLNQKELILNAGLSFVEYDAIKTESIPFEIPHELKNAIFTSQNAVNAYLKQSAKLPSLVGEGLGLRAFCVGEKTKELLEKNGLKVVEIGENASKLGEKIVKSHKNESFHFFTGNKRRNELPQILADSNIKLTEIEVYKTSLNTKEFYQNFDGILFFSPSGVQSFATHNKFGESLAICIGNTTATEARKHTQNIEIANSTSVESVIARAVKVLKTRPQT